MLVSSSSQPPPPLTLPVAGTLSQVGRVIEGLSLLTIEQTSSPAPPAGGDQSSQPTLPGFDLHRGTVTTVPQVHGFDPGTTSPLPSHAITSTGIATGRTAQWRPSVESQ